MGKWKITNNRTGEVVYRGGFWKGLLVFAGEIAKNSTRKK